MSKFLLIISVFAMVVTTTASIAHAHMDTGSTSIIHLNADSNDNMADNDEPITNNECDMGCCGTCSHNHLISNGAQAGDMPFLGAAKLATIDIYYSPSDLICGLKRPPKA
tara:strand:+ start:1090 stop:1419 length:330 start_codon:yes stop_codon:yes gene_type:complete